MTRDIKVEYDGKYPTSCMGTLVIKVDGKEVYNKNFCCSSSGTVTFDKDWNETVECGDLTWNDAKYFDNEIKKAVHDVLCCIDVCCGGCV